MKERKRTTDEDDALKLTFEQRSEEVTDIIERMPTGWTNLVTAIITAIVLVMVTLGCVIKYPDRRSNGSGNFLRSGDYLSGSDNFFNIQLSV